MATQTVNFYQPGTEAGIDAAQIARQRALAELMMKQGQTPQQAQMVGGHYVAPGALSYVNQLAQALGGQYMQRQADQSELALGQKIRGQQAQEAQNFMQAMNGTPAVTEEQAGPPAPGQGAPMREITPAVAGDQNRALALALGSQNPLLQGLAPELLKRQMDSAEFSKALAAAGLGGQGSMAAGGSSVPAGAATGGPVPIAGTAPSAQGNAAQGATPNTLGLNPGAFALSASPNARAQALGKMVQEANKPQVLAEGGSLVMPNGQVITTAPKTLPGTTIQNGVAQAVPNFAQIQANQAGLTAAAEAAARDPYAPAVTVNTPEGPRQMTPAQQRAMMNGGQQPLPPAQTGMRGQFVIDQARGITPESIISDINAIRDPQERANAIAAFNQQMRASGGNLPAQQNGGGQSQLPGVPLKSESQEKYDTTRAENYAKTAPVIQQGGNEGAGTLRTLDQLQALYADPNVAKGALAENISGLKNLAASFGVDVKGVGSEQAIEAITNKMALASRSTAEGGGMPGAMSDSDRKFLSNIQPGLSKTPEGRAKIIDASRKVAQRQIDVANLARQYEQQNGRLDVGFDKVLADYANRNPMFTQGGTIDWSKAQIQRVK